MTFATTSPMLPFVQKLESRTALSSEERQAILVLPFTPEHVRPNRDFVLKGELIRHCSFVLEGVVGAFEQNRQGERQIVAVYINGDMIDLHGVVMPDAMSALQALAPTTVLKVSHSALDELVDRYPNIAEAFWRECSADAGILREWIVNIGRRDARSRMAHFFCELACRWQRQMPVDGTRIPYSITQQQLAEILSMTPVHINRTMQGLRKDGLIDTLDRSVMRFLDWKRLTAICDFDAEYLQLDDGNRSAGPPPLAAPQVSLC